MDPGVITIKTAGYCKDCPFVDIITTRFHAYTLVDIAPEFKCKNHAICDRVYHNTVMSLTEGAENDDSQKVH